MTILDQFKSDHSNKHSVFLSQEISGDDRYKNLQVIKVAKAKDGCYVILFTDYYDRPSAEYWVSKRTKNSKRYYYNSDEHRQRCVKKFIADEQHYSKRIIEDREKAKQVGRGVEVGDILSAVWGYDQTNYNYYEITALIGNKMVEVREIAQMIEHTEHMQGKCSPARGEYISEPMRRVAKNGSVKIDEVRWASICSHKVIAGTKIYETGHWTAYH